MLDSLVIKNYRQFHEIKFERLGRVNLFIGKNRSGKSSVLEAVNIYCNNARESILYSSVAGRDEDFVLSNAADDYQDLPLRYLFHGYPLAGLKKAGAISIGEIQESHSVLHGRISVEIRPTEVLVVQDQMGRTFYTPAGMAGETRILNQISGFELSGQGRNTYIAARRGVLGELQAQGLREPILKCGFLTTGGVPDTSVVELLDSINVLNLDKELTHFLQLVDERVVKIFHLSGRHGSNSLSGKAAEGRAPFVLLNNVMAPIPLGNLGDGTARLLHILLLMIHSRDGVLLIDEFENGLHWGVHSKIWLNVFQLAKKLNVQVFATTHSLDCVKAFHKAWTENEMEDGACYRLQRDEEGDIIPFELPRNMLGAAIENDVEMR